MGISGLLPLLKPIQNHKHLSEYSGQTIAVDAYVWLHRGTYACATELATGKKAHRYVDYAMHRVRLLKHHGITPYIVFDGGPLPAKKGTESDRKKKRDENLARANALAAQGKHTQAREFYVKCIDVTPQMAYQLIKALRAENIAHVVAPYEADAQMAYLERIGLVHGILTEDSDLLVFGCRSVLLKLDTVESTVVAIRRADFASLAGGGISLHGWSDVQFRAMAILSGCDYLASIPSVGLKTAWTLLRKHHTVENVIRALRLEGKKNVPAGYLEAFRLAEKVFLHQRVYDPLTQMLVHLTPIPDGEDWDDEKEAHVGGYIEPSLAKKVAEGDACPITLLPMEDINPTFVPRALKPLPLNNLRTDTRTDARRKGKEKAAIPEKARSTNILTFFTPKAKTEPRSPQPQPAPPSSAPPGDKARPAAGQASGKRTLAEVMEHDIALKRQKRKEREPAGEPAPQSTRSRFFAGPSSPVAHACDPPVAGPSGLPRRDKENVPCRRASPADALDEGEISMGEDVADPVTQEDGYMSPAPSCANWDSPELSSPARPRAGGASRFPAAAADDEDDIEDDESGDDDDFGADVLSSPCGPSRQRRAARRHTTPAPTAGNVLVQSTPSPRKARRRTRSPPRRGADLRALFEHWSDGTSDIDEGHDSPAHSRASSPATPRAARVHDATPDDEEIDPPHADAAAAATATSGERIADGWWDRWACAEAIPAHPASKIGSLRRRETTLTAGGRLQRAAPPRPAPPQGRRAANRRACVPPAAARETGPVDAAARAGPSGPEDALGARARDAQARLAAFRYAA